jgi:hypothetical protein
MPAGSGKGRGRRPREQEPREHVVKAKLSAAEKASLSAAAERDGLAVAAYLVQAGLDAAEHRAMPIPVFQQEMLRELVRIRGLVHQAAARLHTTDEPGPDPDPTVAYCMRVIRHLDEAALLLSRRLR